MTMRPKVSLRLELSIEEGRPATQGLVSNGVGEKRNGVEREMRAGALWCCPVSKEVVGEVGEVW